MNNDEIVTALNSTFDPGFFVEFPTDIWKINHPDFGEMEVVTILDAEMQFVAIVKAEHAGLIVAALNKASSYTE